MAVRLLLLFATLSLPSPAAGQELDFDRDGIPDAADVCPFWAGADQSDADGNGIGDACECGDQTGDGTINVEDILAISAAIFEPSLVTPLCDANGDALCNVGDILAVNAGIFGASTHCAHSPSLHTTDAATDLLLTIPGASLVVPAASLPEGTSLGLTALEVEEVDPAPTTGVEEAITKVFAVVASGAAPATGALRLALDVPMPVPDRFYARVRVVGGQQVELQSDSDWLIQIGEFDAATSVLSIEVYSTASRFEAVVVRRTDPAPAGAALLPGQLPPFQPPEGTARWESHPWAVACDPALVGDAPCSMLPQTFAQHLASSDTVLTGLGLGRGLVDRVQPVDLARSGLLFATAAQERFGSAESDGTVFVAQISEPDADAQGEYWPSTGNLRLRVDADTQAIIHELTHAAQRVEAPHLANWLSEGTASAMQSLAPGFAGPGGSDFRWRGLWRDWERELSSDHSVDAYTVAEFWLSVDPTLAYLPALFEALGPIGPQPAGSLDYPIVSFGLGAALAGTTLVDAYVDLIRARAGAGPAYPHCSVVPSSCPSAGCDESVALGGVSAVCQDRSVVFDPPCPSGPVTVDVSIQGADAVILDGDLQHPATILSVPEGAAFRLWLIHHDLGGVSQQVGVSIRQQSCCGNGLLEGAEECDDGGLASGDGCSESCALESECGNGIVEKPPEECDDGNTTPGDGCSPFCLFDPCPLGQYQCGETTSGGSNCCSTLACRVVYTGQHLDGSERAGEGACGVGCSGPGGVPFECGPGEVQCIGWDWDASTCYLGGCCPYGQACLLEDGFVICAP